MKEVGTNENKKHEWIAVVIALCLATLIALAATLVFSTKAHAASPKDVQEVAAMVTDKKVPTLTRVASYFGNDHMGDTITFVHKGMRYTVYNSGERIKADDPNSAWLSVWVRKDGTSGSKNMDTFTDNGFDGNVDFGIDGPRSHLFHSGADGISGKEGLEHEAFWQKKYDTAIKAALEYKRSRK